MNGILNPERRPEVERFVSRRVERPIDRRICYLESGSYRRAVFGLVGTVIPDESEPEVPCSASSTYSTVMQGFWTLYQTP